ncbi:MAG: methyltransferase domain-containing protein [Candidatus Njordarchaeia archaeon]
MLARFLLNKLRCVNCGYEDLSFDPREKKIFCHTCGSAFEVRDGIPIMLRNEELHEIYNVKVFDEHAYKYDKWFEMLKGGVLFQNELAALKLLLKNVEIGEALEIGVGTGRFAHALRVKYGVDPAFKPLLIARNRGIIVVQGVAENLPFKNESFDTAVMIVTVCFVDNLEKSFGEAYRILKENGNLVIGYIDRDTEWGKIYLEKKKSGHLFYKNAKFYSYKEIEELLKRTGFRVARVTSTLSQKPTEKPTKEKPKMGRNRGGFVAILAKKLGDKN